MSRISIDDVRDAAGDTDDLYHEFLREESLSVGLYTIPAGERDPQEPHDEDEVYYVVSGRAEFTHEGDRYPVEPGDCIYVERGDAHRFVDVSETLELLVFFAPAEGTLADG
jgi:mannose-6-phosphate isomerase-like protein (cupin superfamily)